MISVKFFVYILVLALTLYGLDAVRLNEIFKKNRYHQATVMYFIIAISLSYLVTNFIYDIFLYTKIF